MGNWVKSERENWLYEAFEKFSLKYFFDDFFDEWSVATQHQNSYFWTWCYWMELMEINLIFAKY